jgi:hypothetical protein
MSQSRCHLCGTYGKIWDKKPDVFICPNCYSIFSEFGIVLESKKELINLWT